MGEEGAFGLQEVALSRSPFRYYGTNLQNKVSQFEDMFAKKAGSTYALAVSSGTAGLMVALKALKIGYGDKVAIASCTFIATGGAVLTAGAVPVFVDVDEPKHGCNGSGTKAESRS